jgi:hypothetical protein
MNRLSDPEAADRLSGAALDPCLNAGGAAAPAGPEGLPRPDAPAELLRRYSRLLRPFPVKRLADALWYVQADAHAIDHALIGVQLEPPALADEWCLELRAIDDMLWSLTQRCVDAQAELHRIMDGADADERRALTAFVAIMRGLGRDEPPDEPAPFREPVPCGACAGHGGSPSDGDCEKCQGTGIDPSDPQSPL